jgi:protein SCO1/2
MKKTLLICAVVLLPILALGTHFARQRHPQGDEGLRAGTFDPPRDAPGFNLDGSNGSKLSLQDQRGKVVIVEFGYTYCQEVCPITLAHLTETYKRLGNAARDVQLIYVTVDPARDNPERLHEHLATFNPTFLGATGTPEELQAVQKAYGVVAKQVVSPNPALGYAVDHSSSLYLIDREGKLRGLVTFNTPVDDIVHDLQFLLKTGA